jgi:hypothetical protein
MSEENAPSQPRHIGPFVLPPAKPKPLPKPAVELLPHSKTQVTKPDGSTADDLRIKAPDSQLGLMPQEVSLYTYGKETYMLLVLNPPDHKRFLELFEADQSAVTVKLVTCLSNGQR